MFKIITLFILINLYLNNLQATDSLTIEKKNDIRILLELTDVLKLGREIGRSVIHERLLSPDITDLEIPDSLYDELKQDVVDFFNEAMVTENGLIEDLIQIYHKYYSAGEIKELISFYKTDAGKKTISLMPVLLQETSSAIKNWCDNLIPYIEILIERKLDPSHEQAHLNLGKFYFYQGKYKPALNHFDRVFEINKHNFWVLYWKALSYDKLKDYLHARRYYNLFIEQAPKVYSGQIRFCKRRINQLASY